MKIFFDKKEKGQAVILSLIIFLGVSVATIFAMSLPVIQHVKIARDSYVSKQNYFVAEALNEDIMYRLNHSMTVDTTEALQIEGVDAEATITTSSGSREIEIVSEKDGTTRKINATVTTGEGVSFNYGVQVGNGGFVMDNNAEVIGNVYSNGNITGGEISGTAIAANSAALSSDQVNDTPTTPTQSVTFRNASASQDFAQSFKVSTTSVVNKVKFYIKKVGSPSSATVRITTDSSGKPSTTNMLSSNGTLTNTLVTTNYGWVEVVFPSNPQLVAGTTYWLVIDNSSHSSSNYYQIAANSSTYSNGLGKIGQYNGTWSNTSPSGLDAYFNLYLGGVYSTISGVAVGDDAWAHTITDGSVGGTKYCQVGTGCNTSRPDPSSTGFPISDANIDAWKEEAEAGGVWNGNWTATTSFSMGPKKIVGNLNLGNGHDMTLTGTVWVTGTIIASNNNGIYLHSSYGSNSGVLLSDDRISLDNNVDFYNAASGGNILVLTTSDCPTGSGCSGNYAIDIENNVGGNSNDVVFNAQNGTIYFGNNAEAKEATAHTIHLSNNVIITYESGLSDMNFSSGPSGSWSIDSWQEIE